MLRPLPARFIYKKLFCRHAWERQNHRLPIIEQSYLLPIHGLQLPTRVTFASP
jgi:hypothetical protein